MSDRRSFLKSAVYTAAAAQLPSIAFSQSASTAAKDAEAELNAVMDYIYEESVLSDPETRTSLGLDKGEHAAAKRKLHDRSAAGIEKDRNAGRTALARLKQIDRQALSPKARADYDTFDYYFSTVVGAYDEFDYGTFSWPEPYSVHQLGGTYRSIPDFLHNQHSIETREDADAYLSRVAAFAKELDNETARLRAEYAMGVIPPDFAVDRTVAMMDGMLAQKPAETVLVTSIATRTREKGIAGDWSARATRLVEQEVHPALKRQRDQIAGIRSKASSDAGVWKLPKGDDYYKYALRYATTTSLGAEEIHRLGLEQMAELSARADRLLKSQGLTKGTVGERFRALATDARFIYPNTDAGKQELLAYLNAGMVKIQARLPEYFGKIPKAKVEIRRVPPDIEAGATGGYYQPPALDGSRPGAYYINLRDTAETPRWTLMTLTAHEASPGHHHQLALAQESTSVHPVRRLGSFSVYSEGWGLYAEQLADEMGVYEDDPFGQLGYLHSFMFRAARLVVDSGLHHKRWTREQGVDYMVDSIGEHRSVVTTEVERYCVWPGQATSYKIGQTRWLQLREEAKKKLGKRFDLREFHDMALASGTVPLAVLERLVNDWVASKLGKA
ncbi:DUF885 family protein [Steroidobacter sp. S1-65]|uniref:DUF885 family protein n=1 Tax=Steroidobacter gossypii TaxID=2805490 RepID=A0ABS1WZP0_9GAMM|nr:DUF885 family protein [Steroidobacter gossypii]MBM0106432.1 DUF885 family protein [Steroidobacter gossypii]